MLQPQNTACTRACSRGSACTDHEHSSKCTPHPEMKPDLNIGIHSAQTRFPKKGRVTFQCNRFQNPPSAQHDDAMALNTHLICLVSSQSRHNFNAPNKHDGLNTCMIHFVKRQKPIRGHVVIHVYPIRPSLRNSPIEMYKAISCPSNHPSVYTPQHAELRARTLRLFCGDRSLLHGETNLGNQTN